MHLQLIPVMRMTVALYVVSLRWTTLVVLGMPMTVHHVMLCVYPAMDPPIPSAIHVGDIF